MIESFPIVPASGRTMWYIVAFVVVLFAGITLLLVATARGATTSVFELSPAGLRLRGDLYGRLIPAAALRGEDARMLDLSTEPQLAPRFRTMGTGLGNYQAGWFRLRNGERALLYLTDRSRAVYVPTTAGYSVLLSPQEPERFLQQLRTIAGGRSDART